MDDNVVGNDLIVELKVHIVPLSSSSSTIASWITTLRVNRYLTFEDLTAILRAKFGRLQGSLLYYRMGQQVGQIATELVVRDKTKHDNNVVLIVREEKEEHPCSPPPRWTGELNNLLFGATTTTSTLACGTPPQKKQSIDNAFSKFNPLNDGEETGSAFWTSDGRTVVVEQTSSYEGDLEEALLQSVISASAATKQHTESPTSVVPKPSAPPLHHHHLDLINQHNTGGGAGVVIAQGSISQYALKGGRSACTPICLIACFHALKLGEDSNDDIKEQRPVLMMTPAAIDDIIHSAVEIYQQSRQGQEQQHASIEDLFQLEAFKDVCACLKKGEPFQGIISNRDDLIKAFQASLDFAQGSKKLGVVFTKSGETVLVLCCVAGNTTVQEAEETSWYLFNSHGQSHSVTKRAYWMKFRSFHRLLDALLTLYPPQHFGGDGDGASSLQANMYNLFETTPIVLIHDKEDSKMPTCPRAGEEERKLAFLPPTASLSSRVAIITPDFAALEKKPPPPDTATAACVQDFPPSPIFVTSSIDASKVLTAVFDKTTFECAISMEIMADPVVCSDGKIYDRPNIEQHFEAREAMAEEARHGSNDNQNDDDDDDDNNAATTCCGANRAPIQLTSPITGQVVDGILTPVHLIEQQIVGLVENNAFMMTDEELQDWQERRAAKQKRDQERQEELKRQQEREEEMRRNAATAEERGAQEELSRMPQEPALQVRIDRDTNDETECLGEHDIGLSVMLANKENRIPANYAASGTCTPRCMVACCAVSLQSNTWCARCARLVCDDCLSFGVTNIQQPQAAHAHLSRICFECVTQLVDCALDSQDILTRQKRAVLVASLERQLTLLSNRASTKQDTVVRHEIHDEFGGRMEEVEYTISRLEMQLQELREQVQEQERRAADAAADDDDDDGTATLGNSNQHVSELGAQLEALEREYNECMEEQEPSDEEEQFTLMCRRSDLLFRVEEARTRLAVAESSSTAETTTDDSTSNTNESQQQEELESLHQRLAALSKGTSKDEAFEQQLARATEQSEICDQIEKLNMSIAMNRSSQSATTTSHCNNSAPPSKGRKNGDRAEESTSTNNGEDDEEVDLLVEYVRLTNQDISGLSFDAQTQHLARVSEIDAMLSAAEEVFFRNQLEAVPTDSSAVEARQDLVAIGTRLTAWPLPLGLEYPTPRMERQLGILRNALELRKVESKRSYEGHMTEQYDALVERREALEDEIAETRRALEDAESQFQQEEERRRQERVERRRREEAARLAREQALREEAQRAREAAEEMRRQHQAEERATEEALANARTEGGAASLGGRGDLRMCRRCRAGPIENMACSDLGAHNNSSRDYKGRAVMSVSHPNACRNCKWFNPNWHSWPYWDGVFGPH